MIISSNLIINSIIVITLIVSIVLVIVNKLGKTGTGGPGPSPPGPSPPSPSPPGPSPGPPSPIPSTYKCVFGQCIADNMGRFSSFEECNKNCTDLRKLENKPAKFPIKASTTTFASDLTSCGCQQNIMNLNLSVFDDLTEDKKPLGVNWYGSATPEWQQSPYNGSLNDVKTPKVVTTKEPRNASVGWGGCGSCFILETTGEKNNEGVTIEAGKKIGVIVTDNCEASNPANQKWCIPYKNGKVVPSSFSQQEDKTYKLNIEGCSMQDFENGTCTNGAGYGYHFDVQIAPSSTSEIGNRKNLPWKLADNPIVNATRVQCPLEVTQQLNLSCGSKGCQSARDNNLDGACGGCPFRDNGKYFGNGAILPFWGDTYESCTADKGQFGFASGFYTDDKFVTSYQKVEGDKQCCPGNIKNNDNMCQPSTNPPECATKPKPSPSPGPGGCGYLFDDCTKSQKCCDDLHCVKKSEYYSQCCKEKDGSDCK